MRQVVPAIAVLLFSFAMVSNANAGPIEQLYATAGDNGVWFIIQGNNVNTIQDHGQQEYALAVDGDVRTMGVNGGELGAQYTLNGTPLGPTYLNQWGSEMIDGTTDGTFNYAVQWPTGQVIRFDRNWANGSVLFGGLPTDTIGLTYDTATKTFWTATRSLNLVQQYSLSGTLLSQFAAPGGPTGLAYDPVDGTLWLLAQGFGNQLDQYTTSGVLLSAQSYGQLSGANTLGLEFDLENMGNVPEPASLFLLGSGFLALGSIARKRVKRS